jgi:hypothetical protein
MARSDSSFLGCFPHTKDTSLHFTTVYETRVFGFSSLRTFLASSFVGKCVSLARRGIKSVRNAQQGSAVFLKLN